MFFLRIISYFAFLKPYNRLRATPTVRLIFKFYVIQTRPGNQ
jgi:hypothetical protein